MQNMIRSPYSRFDTQKKRKKNPKKKKNGMARNRGILQKREKESGNFLLFSFPEKRRAETRKRMGMAMEHRGLRATNCGDVSMEEKGSVLGRGVMR